MYDNDFSTTWYPGANSYTRWIYGELDYFSMTPPSLSCMAIMLPQNTNLWKYTGTSATGTRLRPAVRSGENINIQ